MAVPDCGGLGPAAIAAARMSDDVDAEIESNSILKIDNRVSSPFQAHHHRSTQSLVAASVRETSREKKRVPPIAYDSYSPSLPTPQEFTPSPSLSFYATDVKLLKRPGTSLDCCLTPSSPQRLRLNQTPVRPYSAQGIRNQHEWNHGLGEHSALRAESKQKCQPRRPKTATPTPPKRLGMATVSSGKKYERSRRKAAPVKPAVNLTKNCGLPMTDKHMSRLIFDNIRKSIVEERESFESTSCCYDTVLEHVRVLTDGDELPSNLLTSTACLLLSSMGQLFSRFQGIYSKLLSIMFQSIFIDYTENTKPESFAVLSTYSEIAKTLQQERDETEAKSERAQMANKAVSGIILSCSKRWQELTVALIFKTWKRCAVEQKHQIRTISECLQHGKNRRAKQNAFSEWKTLTIVKKNRNYVQDSSRNTTVLTQWLEDSKKQISAKEREIQKLRGAKVLNKQKTDALTEMLAGERKENSRLRTKLRDVDAQLTNLLDIVSSTFCELRRRHVDVLSGSDSDISKLEKIKEVASITSSCGNTFPSPAQCGTIACETPDAFLKHWASSVSGRPLEENLSVQTLKQLLCEMSKGTSTPLTQVESAQETVLALRQFGVCGSYTALDIQKLSDENQTMLLSLAGSLFQRNISGDLNEGEPSERTPARLPRDRLEIGEVMQLRNSLLSDMEDHRVMKQIGWAIHSYSNSIRTDQVRLTSQGFNNPEIFTIPSTMFDSMTLLVNTKLRRQLSEDLRSEVISTHLRTSHKHTYRVYLWYRLLEKSFNSQVWVFFCDTLQIQDERVSEVYFELLGKEVLMSYRGFLASLVVVANYENGTTFANRWGILVNRLGYCPYLDFDQIIFSLSDKVALKLVSESPFTKRLMSSPITEELLFSAFDMLKLPVSRAAVCVLLNLILHPTISPSSPSDLPGQPLSAKHIPSLVVGVAILVVPDPCLSTSQRVIKFLSNIN